MRADRKPSRRNFADFDIILLYDFPDMRDVPNMKRRKTDRLRNRGTNNAPYYYAGRIIEINGSTVW
jgi:hypothetical protein